MTKPHILLLPGAWHYPSCYSLIIPKLEAAGYTVHTKQLPSVTDQNPPKDLSADVAAVQSVLDKAIGCALIPGLGDALAEVNHGQPSTWWSPEDGEFALLRENAKDIFYNDLPPEQRAYWSKKVSRTRSLHPFTAKAIGEAWIQIPTYYLICEDDLVISKTRPEAMTSMVRDKGGDLLAHRLKSSHSPFLSHVDETVAWIRKVAVEHV